MGILDPKPITPAGLDTHPRLSATALNATYGPTATPMLTAIDERVSVNREWFNANAYAEKHGISADDALVQSLSASRVVTLTDEAVPVTRQVVLGNNNRLIGNGGKNATLLVAGAGWNAAAHPSVVKMTGTEAHMEHLAVDARLTTAPDCVRIEATYRPVMTHVQVLGGKVGINVLSGLESRYVHVSAKDCAESGAYVQNVADTHWDNFDTDNCDYGFRSVGGSIYAQHIHAIKSKKHGLYMVGPGSSQFDACQADTNGENGFHIVNPNNTRFTSPWSFRNGTANSTSHNFLFSGSVETTVVGGASNNEGTVLNSWNFANTQTSLALIGCSATAKDVTGDLTNVEFIGCMGRLAKLNTAPRVARRVATLAAGGVGTIACDLGYTPDMTNNAKVYRLNFTNRGATDTALAMGYLLHAEVGNTSGGGTSAKTFHFGDATKAGGAFTATFARVGAVMTATITNNSDQSVSYGLELSAMQGPKN